MARLTAQVGAQLTDLLKAKACTQATLAAAVGLSKRSIGRFLASVRSEVYVAGYGPDARGRPFVEMWRWGRFPDAARPGRLLTPADQMRKSRRKKGCSQ